MNTFGQLCLLGALVCSGYSAFGCIVGRQRSHRLIARSGVVAAVGAFLLLTVVSAILAWALLAKDFRFAYVAQYSSRLLPWHYSLSAMWVGQAGSLLTWAWFLGAVAMAFRFGPRQQPSPLLRPAFGVLMACLCFLVAIMVFGADPMKPSLSVLGEGAGLSPALQHPAMLLHPPIVFLGYAASAVPFALAVIALATGRLDADWVREARRWALFAWAVLGIGILLGAQWAYEELGWGGYWSWDPVENGSLIPWLTGTALIHALLAWQYRNALKKTAIALAIATFVLCNFATFLTRSGIFSSLHAFSESPIGWMFLGLMIALTVGGGILIVLRRSVLTAEFPIPSVWARESLVLIAIVALVLLSVVAFVGTLTVPLSNFVFGQKIVVGAAFYNNVLIPTGLLLLTTIAMAPLVRWGAAPTAADQRMLLVASGAGIATALLSFALGVRHPILLAVVGLATVTVAALAGTLVRDARRRNPNAFWLGLTEAIRGRRRRYAGYLIHVGFVCLAIGVTGSSLGTHRHEVVLGEGETADWAGYSIRLVALKQREAPDKLVAEAQLEISRRGNVVATLWPAQHLHLLQNEWTTEVAIHPTWRGDLYAIVHGGVSEGRADFTFVDNPLMRWMWLGGWIAGAGALFGLWPDRRRASDASAAYASKDPENKKSSNLMERNAA